MSGGIIGLGPMFLIPWGGIMGGGPLFIGGLKFGLIAFGPGPLRGSLFSESVCSWNFLGGPKSIASNEGILEVSDGAFGLGPDPGPKGGLGPGPGG